MIHLVLLAAVIHVYIWVLESLQFGRPRTNATFNLAPEQVETVRPWAFNQGFYNLFLALAIIAGWVLWTGVGPQVFDSAPIGATLMGYGLVSILGAGLVLVISNPKMLRSALIQIVPAVLGLAGLVVTVAR